MRWAVEKCLAFYFGGNAGPYATDATGKEFPHPVLSRDTGAHTPSGSRLYGPNKNKLTGV